MSASAEGTRDEEPALLERAHRFAGLTIAELSHLLGVPLPRDATKSKGAIGHLVERALGASRGSRPGPDFASGIELKTLPVDARGRPAESTFVTVLSASDLELAWEASHARAKLAHVLFVPVESRTVRPFAERRFGRAFVWRPSPEEDALLARDWLLLRDRILVHGEVRASEGEALQIRPKGKNAEDTTRRTDDEGAPTRQLKRGFYLRASFTERVLARSGLAVRRHT
ncbi:MAG: DNA mismatch repair protein MutH [Sandaracinaceae bacterium]|nr:DNA mismatch repair protein MutH [Sandaracinaceae bacterium]